MSESGACPNCGQARFDGFPECPHCDIIFAKFEQRHSGQDESSPAADDVYQPEYAPPARDVYRGALPQHALTRPAAETALAQYPETALAQYQGIFPPVTSAYLPSGGMGSGAILMLLAYATGDVASFKTVCRPGPGPCQTHLYQCGRCGDGFVESTASYHWSQKVDDVEETVEESWLFGSMELGAEQTRWLARR